MADEQKKSTSEPADSGVRKRYAKPTVSSEPIYETMALACVKTPAQGSLCADRPHNS
jgi:hypothetical protein